MSKLRVLVTDADTPKSLAIVRALGEQHDVWTAANSRIALAAWSRYTQRHLTYPFTQDSGLCPWVLDACKTHQIQIVIPPEESSSWLLSRESARFKENGVTVAAL